MNKLILYNIKQKQIAVNREIDQENIYNPEYFQSLTDNSESSSENINTEEFNQG